MAIAILKYDLTDSDDRMGFLRATKSLDMAMALWEMTYNVKKKMQSQVENENLDAYDAVEKVFDKFWEIIKDHDINIDSLIE